jgi:arabinose-5-phosphate isomerase
VLLLSASGETEEIVRILPALRERVATTLAITCRAASSLATEVDLALVIGQVEEACTLGLAPSTSTTLMMALGDALALVTSNCRGFTSQQFALFHPAGSLGKRLSSAKELMRPLSQCRVASAELSVREVIVQVSRPGRRTGAIMLTGANGQLLGIFTDSDLARLLEREGSEPGETGSLERPISQVMSSRFQTIQEDCLFPEVARMLTEFKISELPVVDRQGRPLGIVDITDLFGTALQAAAEERQAEDRLASSRTASQKTASRKTQLRPTPEPHPKILPLRKFGSDRPG